jgi:hypothetical protein
VLLVGPVDSAAAYTDVPKGVSNGMRDAINSCQDAHVRGNWISPMYIQASLPQVKPSQRSSIELPLKYKTSAPVGDRSPLTRSCCLPPLFQPVNG